MSQELDDAMAHRDKVLAELRVKLVELNSSFPDFSAIEPITAPCFDVSISDQISASMCGAINFGSAFFESIKEQRLIELCNTPCWRYKA